MTSHNWTFRSLGELIETNFDTYSEKEGWDYINYLDTGNITDNRIDEIIKLEVGIDKIPSRAKRKVKGGDVVISTVRPNQRHFGIIKSPPKNFLVSTGFTTIRANFEKASSGFVFWYLSQPIIVEYLQGIGETSTSAYPAIKPSDIEALELFVPPLPEQKAIASVLGALDDKIENNLQMNETLEEMARAIFKSWFVDFDPVHAKAASKAPAHMDADTAALFPSSFGEDGLPVGWQTVAAETISNITIGKTPPRKEHNWFSNSNDDIKWASIRDMGECGTYISQTAETLTSEAIKKFNVRVIPENTVILSFKLTVGRVALTDELMATNEAIAHFGQLDSKYGVIQSEYLYAYLKEFNFDKLGSTSSIATAVNSKTIKAMPIMLSDKSCREAFQKIMLPLFGKIKVNLRENQTLAELRDTLLPKLMSGEIRVKDVEREVEAVV